MTGSEQASDEEGLSESGFVGQEFLGDGVFGDSVEGFGVKEVQVVSEGVAAWIESLTQAGKWSAVECEEVLNKGLGRLPVVSRPLAQRKGGAVLFGLYGVGGFRGITKASDKFPPVVRYLNQFLRSQMPDKVWTSLYVSHNTSMPMHRDLRNAPDFPVVVRSVGRYRGGGLWVEVSQGPVLKTLPTGERRAGCILDIGQEAASFSGSLWHAPEEWEGTSRWVITGFVPRDFVLLSSGRC